MTLQTLAWFASVPTLIVLGGSGIDAHGETAAAVCDGRTKPALVVSRPSMTLKSATPINESTASHGCLDLGDLNEDGAIDGLDLLTLLGQWGECSDPSECSADINGDGVVDGQDLLTLLGNWGPCPAGCTYLYDSEILNGGVGISAVVMWLSRFDAGEGDVLTAIRSSVYGLVTAGNPIGYAVYDADPDGSVGPLLFAGESVVEEGALGASAIEDRQVFKLPDISVQGQFFVAAWEASGNFPAPYQNMSETGGRPDDVWVAVNSGFGPGAFENADPAEVNNWSFPPIPLGQANPGWADFVWLLCALGEQ